MRISVSAVDCHSFMCFGISTGLREEAANDNRPFRQLIYVKPEEQLDVLVQRLFANEVSSVPCLTTEPDGRPLIPFVNLPISTTVSHCSTKLCHVCSDVTYISSACTRQDRLHGQH